MISLNKTLLAFSIVFSALAGQSAFSQSPLTKTEQDVVDTKAAYLKALEENAKAKAAIAKALEDSHKKALEDSKKAQAEVVSATADKTNVSTESQEKKVEEKAEVQAKLIAKELASWPTDNDSMTGDTLKFKANAYPFEAVDGNGEWDASSTVGKFCAPKDSRARVTLDDGEFIYVNFKKVANPEASLLNLSFKSRDNENYKCTAPVLSTGVANEYESVTNSDQYRIKKSNLEKFGFYRRGFTYGGLVIPFKYYTGGDKRVSGSATVAPYIGWKGLDKYGIRFTPTFSAGLAFVPINTTTTNEMGMESTTQETKTAFSIAGGLMLSSPENKAFSAGIMIGRDRLSSRDRQADPTAGKTWISVFAGIKFDAGN